MIDPLIAATGRTLREFTWSVKPETFYGVEPNPVSGDALESFGQRVACPATRSYSADENNPGEVDLLRAEHLKPVNSFSLIAAPKSSSDAGFRLP